MGRHLAKLLLCLTICTAFCALKNPGGPAIKSPPESGNFAEFLSAELVKFGGRENKLAEKNLSAEWVIKRDQLGAAIDVTKGDYQALTNALTGEYGAPILYITPTERGPATYVYVASKEGLRLFVKRENKELVEVTILRPFSKE